MRTVPFVFVHDEAARAVFVAVLVDADVPLAAQVCARLCVQPVFSATLFIDSFFYIKNV